MVTMASEVVVIGGGAAGMLAARRAAECGAKVTLLEKNDRLGMKILISGGGKCNLTHDGPMEDVRAQFRPNEARFLKPSFYKSTNEDFLRILHERGMETYVRPDGRVFPVEPANAKDVVALLTRYVEDAGVCVRYGASVSGPCRRRRVHHGRGSGRQNADGIAGNCVYGRVVVPGDGDNRRRLALADGAGPYAGATHCGFGSDVPGATPRADWSGVALRDTTLRARAGAGGKEFARWSGDLLFTHKGVSGPTALGVSREVAEREAAGTALEADLAPSVTWEELQSDLRKQALENPRKTVAALAAPFVPSRLLTPLLASAGIPSDTRGAYLKAKSLNKLVSTIKGWPLGSVRHVPLERGEVVAGGVSLDEVDPQTMQSKIARGLFLCGEVLDIAGPVGGYNLQAAWSTGWVAGESAAQISL